VASWLPLFLFVVLFGLSMDYHVFILSRIREAYDRGAPTSYAVAHGMKTTASVVTAAASIMVIIFLLFTTTVSEVSMKDLGFGLAVAIAPHATLVRGLLLPATMRLGEWNWYLPGWLQWLPQVLPRRGAALLDHAGRTGDGPPVPRLSTGGSPVRRVRAGGPSTAYLPGRARRRRLPRCARSS
jgi:RND superfamily putative drug exporter